MKKIIALSVFIILLSISNGMVFAQEVSPTSIPSELELIKEEYRNLKEQNHELRESILKEREEHYRFIEGTYNTIRNIFLVVLAVLGFLGWRTFKEIKEEAKKLAEQTYKKTVEDNSIGLSNSLQKINTIVERETIFKSKKIGFIYKTAELSDIEEIIKVLNERGFNNVFPMKVNDKTNSNKLNANTYDVFIYFLKDFKTEKEVIKEKVISVIKGTDLPLIIYTNHDNAINKKDIDELITQHKWILPSNNRISLLNSIFNVSNLYS